MKAKFIEENINTFKAGKTSRYDFVKTIAFKHQSASTPT